MTKTEAAWPNAVTLVAGVETTRQRRWAAETAIEIARKLGVGRKVILADVGARTPLGLAAVLGVEAGAGIVDVLFRGESFSAVARRPKSGTFFFLPVGSAPPPLPVLFHHPRWHKIAARLISANAHLLTCVPAEDWLEAGPIPGFESCIVLNGTGVEVELPDGARRLAEFLAPPDVRHGKASVGLSGLESVRAESEAAPAGAAERSGVAGSDEDQRPAAGAAPALGSAGRSSAERWSLPSWAPVESPLARSDSAGPGGVVPRLLSFTRRRSAVPAAAAVAMLALVIAVWSVIGGNGGPQAESVGLEAAADTSAAGPGALALGGGRGARPRETSLPYSVAIASYSSYDDALARQAELTPGDHTVYVAPTPVRGVVYYRVMVGLLPGREEAEAFMARLVREGIKDTVRAWDVRPARLAFNFGVYPTAEDARAVIESLSGQGVPAYMVPARGVVEGGGQAYHVYAGGYETPDDARVLRAAIAKAGLTIELVERVGWVLK